MSVKETVRGIIATILGLDVDQVEDHSKLSADLGADSFDLVEITMEAENEFSVTIDDGEASQVTTAGDFIALVERSIAA